MDNSTLTLALKFETDEGKTRTVSIQPCGDNLDEADVKAAMDAIIASGVFIWEPVGKLGATVTERLVTPIF
jgi:hypothetical protein